MNPEQWKYDTIYNQEQPEGKRVNYGHSNHGERFLGRLRNARSVLDVGCGHNEMIKAIRAHVAGCSSQSGYTSNITDEEFVSSLKEFYLGIDFACPGADTQDDIVIGTDFKDKHFEFVTAFDVMEHLQEDQLEAACTEMARVSSKFIFTISHVPSMHKVNGETLHPTVRPQAWWIGFLMQFSDDVEYVDGSFQGTWK